MPVFRPSTVLWTVFAFCLLSLFACSNKDTTGEIISLNSVMVIDGGSAADNYFTPMNIVIDNEGRIYIFDPICMKIVAYDRSGNYLFEFGRPGEAPGEFSFLFYNCDIDAANNIYTINSPSWIEIFANDGTYIRRITPFVDSIFDIAVYDSSTIYINAVSITGSQEYSCIMQIDGNGETVMEFGSVDVDMDNMPGFMKHSVKSCVIDVDDEGNVYYTSVIDYKIFKYDPDGILLYSIEGQTPFEATWEPQPPYGQRTMIPVVWDLCVDQDKIYVLWAQDGLDRGYRVDVFDKNTGDLLGFFYSMVPSVTRNTFIKIVDGSFFYTASHDDGILYKFEMVYLEATNNRE